MSNPRLSKALMVESNRPGLRVQNMWIFTALPSRNRTSTYTKNENNNCTVTSRKLSIDKQCSNVYISLCQTKIDKSRPGK